jgi:hypothetical protein
MMMILAADNSHAKAVAALVRSSGSFSDGDGPGPEDVRGLGRRPAIGDDLPAPPGIRDGYAVVDGQIDLGREAEAVLREGRAEPGTAVMLTASYTCHSWELLGMWAWTPAFLAACFVAAGSEFTRGAGLGAYMTSVPPNIMVSISPNPW